QDVTHKLMELLKDMNPVHGENLDRPDLEAHHWVEVTVNGERLIIDPTLADNLALGDAPLRPAPGQVIFTPEEHARLVGGRKRPGTPAGADEHRRAVDGRGVDPKNMPPEELKAQLDAMQAAPAAEEPAAAPAGTGAEPAPAGVEGPIVSTGPRVTDVAR